jgi:exopolyphosphatase / guanosine-5'-triphosphate,3'-diphosphate pyrophosphatase
VTRVAAIDLGTNSTRLLVADVDDGSVDEVARRLEITRLGEGVDERKQLLPLPIARVRNCLSVFRRELEELGAARTLAVGTSAIRDAENGEAFLGEVEWSYGFATRLLSGEEEAVLTFAGVTAGRQLPEGTLVFDVGGGSTELLVGGPDGVNFRVSLDVGAVRITERFLGSDPPGLPELVEAAGVVRSLLAERIPEDVRSSVQLAVGVAGTVTTLAAIELELANYDPLLVHGQRVSLARLEEELSRLASLPLIERRHITGLEPERAPVIVGGVIVVREVLDHFGLAEVEASEHDLLYGVALEAAALPEPVEGDAPPGAYTCC